MSDNNSSSGGVGVAGLLGVAFVVLKLCGVIDWSWWWVTLPFYGGAAIVIAVMLVAYPLLVAWEHGKRMRKNSKLQNQKNEPKVIEPVATRRSRFMDKLHEAMEAKKQERK